MKKTLYEVFNGEPPIQINADLICWTANIDLTTIPDAVLKSEWARRTQAKRKTRAGGRPKKETACPKCGIVLGAREMRAHGC